MYRVCVYTERYTHTEAHLRLGVLQVTQTSVVGAAGDRPAAAGAGGSSFCTSHTEEISDNHPIKLNSAD